MCLSIYRLSLFFLNLIACIICFNISVIYGVILVFSFGIILMFEHRKAKRQSTMHLSDVFT